MKMSVSQNANIFMEYNDTTINMCECSASITSLVVLITANQCDNFESIIFINYAIDQCEKKLQISTSSFDLKRSSVTVSVKWLMVLNICLGIYQIVTEYL